MHFHMKKSCMYIMTIIPQEEVIVEVTRKSVVNFPEIAIRELLANAYDTPRYAAKGHKSDGGSI